MTTFKTIKRTVNFKFGQSIKAGTKVEVRQNNENTCLVRTENEPNLEFLVSRDNLK